MTLDRKGMFATGLTAVFQVLPIEIFFFFKSEKGCLRQVGNPPVDNDSLTITVTTSPMRSR